MQVLVVPKKYVATECSHSMMQNGSGAGMLNEESNYCLLSLPTASVTIVVNRQTYTTVKLVYKDHPRDQQYVVPIHRWSLHGGSITWKVYHWGLA